MRKATILEVLHLFLPHNSEAVCGTTLTLRIPNPDSKTKIKIRKSYLV